MTEDLAYTYDLAGRLTQTLHPGQPAGIAVTGTGAGTTVSTAGRTLTRAYDTAARLKTITDFNGAPITYSYDADGNIISRTDPNATATATTLGSTTSPARPAKASCGSSAKANACATSHSIRSCASRSLTGSTSGPTGPAPRPSRRCFSTSGRRLSVRGAHDIVTRIAAAAGLDEGATVHVLRHTFATTLVRGGTDLVIVADLLGHARLETTRGYPPEC